MRHGRVLTNGVTTTCTVKATAKTRMVTNSWENHCVIFIDQCCYFEQMAVVDRQPVQSLKGGCNMHIVSMIFDNTCQSILNTLQLVLTEI